MGLIIPVFYIASCTCIVSRSGSTTSNIVSLKLFKDVLGIIRLTGCSWILLSMTFDVWMRFYILILLRLITRTGRLCESI